jgi:cell division protein FtsB
MIQTKVSQKNRPKRKPGLISSAMRRWFFFGAIGIILVFGFLGLFGKNGVLDMIKLKSMYEALQEESGSLLEEQEELKSEIARLQDNRHLEFLARDRLGLMRPQEFFIILDQPAKDSLIDKNP